MVGTQRAAPRQVIPNAHLSGQTPRGKGPEQIRYPNCNGGLVAARHLRELDHLRIGVINGPVELLYRRARLDRYPVRQPLLRMGATATESVLLMIGGRRPEPDRIELSTAIVIRDSTTTPPRKRADHRRH